MTQQKRKQLTIEEKSRIISSLENGDTNKNLAAEYGVPHSTISGIWKERDKVQKLFDKNLLKMKRARTTKYTTIEEALLKWIECQKENNLPVNGPMLQQKANEFAKRFGEDFVCSSSWIQRFRTRHGFVGRKMCKKASSGDKNVRIQWLLQKWPTLCEDYGPDDIFSADETGLFYDMTPGRTIKEEDCDDGTLNRPQFTIMIATNMTGSCKKKLLVISKPKEPRSFKNMGLLLITYENNVRSWMTPEIFERWLRNWDAELKALKKKIVLLVDICSAHPTVTDLSCIKLVFLPPSVSQPIDQGIARSLKYNYRRAQVLKLIENLDRNEQKSLKALDALFMLSEAWENVSPKTIATSFIRAGFKHLLSSSATDDYDEESNTSLPDNDDEVNISLAQLAQNLRPAVSTTEVEEFIDVDHSVAVCAPTREDEVPLCFIAVNESQYENNEQEESEEFTVPSLNDAMNAVSVLRKILIFNEQFQNLSNYDNILVKLQRELQRAYIIQKCAEQTEGSTNLVKVEET